MPKAHVAIYLGEGLIWNKLSDFGDYGIMHIDSVLSYYTKEVPLNPMSHFEAFQGGDKVTMSMQLEVYRMLTEASKNPSLSRR